MPKSKAGYYATQYRARGYYKPTGRDSWVTTEWRRTEKEAKARSPLI